MEKYFKYFASFLVACFGLYFGFVFVYFGDKFIYFFVGVLIAILSAFISAWILFDDSFVD